MRSLWREFEFWLMVVQKAVVPTLSILEAIDNWPEIRESLMESPSKRQLQLENVTTII